MENKAASGSSSSTPQAAEQLAPKTKNALRASHGEAEAAEAVLDGESLGSETPRWHPFQGRENVHLHM
jgi:hypothetical protein